MIRWWAELDDPATMHDREPLAKMGDDGNMAWCTGLHTI